MTNSDAIRNEPSNEPTIVIIGAGLAGLSAALTLFSRGYPFMIYEARDRVGGRVYSKREGWEHRQVSEWGGELIDSGHEHMLGLIEGFDLELEDLVENEREDSLPRYYLNGLRYSEEQAQQDFKAVQQAALADMATFTWPVTYDSVNNESAIALSNMSLATWIESRVPGGLKSQMGRLLAIAYTTEYGAPIEEQTALNLLGFLGFYEEEELSLFGYSDERHRIKGGNQKLPEVIMACFPEEFAKFGHVLTKVEALGDETQLLTFDNGEVVKADYTILALPSEVMKRIDFSEAKFDERKIGQIQALKMGNSSKLNLQFRERFWNNESGDWNAISNGDSYSDSGYQTTWDVSREQSGDSGILNNYRGGTLSPSDTNSDIEPFLDEASPHVQRSVQDFLNQVESVYPGAKEHFNGRAALSSWINDPFALGGYSYWPKGYCHKYLGYEGVSQGRIHFAGEYCSLDYPGYMEGAVREGYRAGLEVILRIDVDSLDTQFS